MDFSKLVDFLQTYPIWFRLAVTSWIFLTAIVCSGLLLVTRITHSREQNNQSNIAAKAVIKAPEQPIASTQSPPSQPTHQDKDQDFLSSLESYVLKRQTLDGRFVQLEQFDKSVLGKDVEWNGAIYSVSGLTDESVDPKITVDSLQNERLFFMASAAREQKLFLSSLRKGDKVTVTGKIEMAGERPSLVSEKIELIRSDD